ncbi:hypothetical protein B4102_0236 [Heyndrickxia sporothermodurans]|uniref:Uncharacterized protein n=1 Tax=Heyndrickxia sporothermodurans TaxID=46224 RepID=A0A150KSC3_9BACI|nr:hypothetical protein [Heyndrickxia sporothermodurans]KYD02642.1 hypothetical protein B4102_0236 [Heyndrickxia sporothermodurans]
MILKALQPVFVDGIIVEVGDKFSCPNDFAKKLIKSKAASIYKETEKQNDNPKDFHDLLNKAFNKEPLIEAAETVGVELTEEQKKLKDSVIEQIISQNKSDEVLGLKEI